MAVHHGGDAVGITWAAQETAKKKKTSNRPVYAECRMYPCVLVFFYRIIFDGQVSQY